MFTLICSSLISYAKAKPHIIATIGAGVLIAVAPSVAILPILVPLGFGPSGVFAGTYDHTRI